MAWYDEAVFYHIYPLGLTGAPRRNDYGEPVHRLNMLMPWIGYLREMGFTALYIGPLFESEGHGYETTDYKKLDSRLGTNEDLAAFVKACHEAGLKVILDGVFNHTGRSFFAFKDIQEKREASPYRDWYCGVNFQGNTEYNDGFSYENWGGYNLLVKLNQRSPAVRDYMADVVRFWIREFDIDGIRLDAADVLDFDFMKMLRSVTDACKADFWLMGEVIHGDYSRWANADTLHSVTNYALHKALYSGHNDHNYFEIAHTIRYIRERVGTHIRLYNFVDNHDVERISTKLTNKAHYLPVHILLYTLPGIPSVYYGSEFGIEGRKERGSDDSLRPHIDLSGHKNDRRDNPCTALIAALGAIHNTYRQDLVWGDYRELSLTTTAFAYARGNLIIAVNNSDNEQTINVPAGASSYTGLLGGARIAAEGGRITITLPACQGDIFAPDEEKAGCDETPAEKESAPAALLSDAGRKEAAPAALPDTGKEEAASVAVDKETASAIANQETASAAASPERSLMDRFRDSHVSAQNSEAQKSPDKKPDIEIPDIPYEEMNVEQLQAVILNKMAKNGPLTDRMKKDVTDNIWHDSLVAWVKSFR